MPISLPTPLLEAIRDGRATLFLGAGASQEAGFPGVESLKKYIVDKAGDNYKGLSQFRFDAVVEILYQEKGYGKAWIRNQIINYFASSMSSIKDPPSKAHNLITKLRWRRVYTTNYDRLIELSYDLNKERVQRLLPVIKPDPQLYTLKKDVVQLIKLNGSIDKAESESSHELVITFSEQENAKINNAQFYEFLKQDSVNGPIIFIGFQFKTPGSDVPGSSPEFSAIESVVKLLNNVRENHYCVLPYDEETFEGKLVLHKLQSIGITPIKAHFGEFMDSVFLNIIEHPISLSKRADISIKLGKSFLLINPDEYSKDQTHFDLIGPHLKTNKIPSVEDSLNGNANWDSYYNDNFIQRECKLDFFTFLSKYDNKNAELVSFVTSPGWGKTTFLKQVAIELAQKGKPVIWLNPFATVQKSESGDNPILFSNWDDYRIDIILSYIQNELKNQELLNSGFNPIIIADDMPGKTEEILKLFRILKESNKKFLLVISLRDTDYEYLVKDEYLLQKSIIYKPELKFTYEKDVSKLLDLCAKNKINNLDNEYIKNNVIKNIFEYNAEKSLLLSLQVIFDKQHRPFKEIITSIWNEITDPVAKELLIKVSSMHQYGNDFYPSLYTLINSLDEKNADVILKTYNSLLDKKILFEDYIKDTPCVRTLHSLISDKLIEIAKDDMGSSEIYLISLIKNMLMNDERDLYIIRSLLRQINEYKISVSSEEYVVNIFEAASKATNNDWVVCHQFAKYYLNHNMPDYAKPWNDLGLITNKNHTSLIHQKGHILFQLGVQFKRKGLVDEASNSFNEAKKVFSKSRFGYEPNEYGYVTHLELLMYLYNETNSEVEKQNILLEGVMLLKQGLLNIPADKFNLLLMDKFKFFKIDENKFLLEKIEQSIKENTASIYSVLYYIDKIYDKNGMQYAIDLLHNYRRNNPKGIMTFIKEARIYIKEGDYLNASTILHSAKLRLREAENTEVVWELSYLDLITSLINNNYSSARDAAIYLYEEKFYPRKGLARGYIWKYDSINIPKDKRKFIDHAKIFSGQIIDIKSSRQYGRIELKNYAGDVFYIDFKPDPFGRKDLRRLDYIDFIIRINNWGLEAESPHSNPYVNTFDDFYTPD